MVIKLPVQRPVHQHQPPACVEAALCQHSLCASHQHSLGHITSISMQYYSVGWVVFSYNNTLIRLFSLYTGLIHNLLLTMKENTKNIWHRISLIPRGNGWDEHRPQCLSTALQPGPVEVSAGGGAEVARCWTSAADDPSVFGFHNHGEGSSLEPSPRWKRLLTPS